MIDEHEARSDDVIDDESFDMYAMCYESMHGAF